MQSQPREFERESTNFRSSGTNWVVVVNIVSEYYTTIEQVRAARLKLGLRADLQPV